MARPLERVDVVVVPPVVHELVATEAALDKLGARSISDEEAAQLPANQHIVIGNLRGARDRSQPRERRLMIGSTNGGRVLTLVIEETHDPESWLVITGWDSTVAERKILG